MVYFHIIFEMKYTIHEQPHLQYSTLIKTYIQLYDCPQSTQTLDHISCSIILCKGSRAEYSNSNRRKRKGERERKNEYVMYLRERYEPVSTKGVR